MNQLAGIAYGGGRRTPAYPPSPLFQLPVREVRTAESCRRQEQAPDTGISKQGSSVLPRPVTRETRHRSSHYANNELGATLIAQAEMLW